MARLRTYHRRKASRIRRDQERCNEVMAALDALALKMVSGRTAMQAFAAAINQMGQAMQKMVESYFKSLPLSPCTELDAEPFWEEWPEIIDG